MCNTPVEFNLPQPGVSIIRAAPQFAYMTEALRAGLSESGYDVGRNVVIEDRWADEQRDRLSALAAELICKPVAVIVASAHWRGGSVAAGRSGAAASACAAHRNR